MIIIIAVSYTHLREILRVENMTVVNQDQFEVVKDVSFSVRGGEIFAIAGVAGNGQIELADAIAGLLPVHKGKICLLYTSMHCLRS